MSDDTEKDGYEFEKKTWRIINRIGAGYAWPPTVIYVALGIIISVLPLVLGGVPFSLIATDFLSWMILVVPFITYVMRSTLNDFRTTLREPSIKEAFPEDGYVTDKHNESHKLDACGVWNTAKELNPLKWQGLYGVIFAIALVLVVQPWNWPMVPFGGLDYRGIANGFTAARDYMISFWVVALAFFVGVDVSFILGMIFNARAISTIKAGSQASNDSKISENRSRLTKVDVHFFDFHSAVTEIGGFLYRLCVKVIVGGFIVVLAFITYDTLFTPVGQVSFSGVTVSIIVMLGVFALFVFPQLSIHSSLKKAKSDTLKTLRKLYGEMQKDLIESINNPKKLKEGSKWENNGQIIDHATALDNLITHVKDMGDWSFSWPTALKLLAAAAVPLITAIPQLIASGLLKQVIPT
jgi:hypothetical protein